MGNDDISVDLSGLNARDLRDIDRSMDIQRERLCADGLDKYTIDCMMKCIYRALVNCKKMNKEKYTPKKYRKNS